MLVIRIVLIRSAFGALQMLYRPHAEALLDVQLVRDDPVLVSEWVIPRRRFGRSL